MTLVRAIRNRTGLSQTEFAERAGTSRPRLSAYETGRTFPELDTLERIVAAADAEFAIVARGTAMVQHQVAHIRQALLDGDEPWAFRLACEIVAGVRSETLPVGVVDQDPGRVGDVRWDALLGGIVEMLCHEFDHPVPSWASAPGRSLTAPWFYTRLRSLWPYVFLTTPAALASRGVLVSANSLVSV